MVHSDNRRLLRVAMAAAGALWLSGASAQEQSLIDAARREGVVTWYTTQIINQFARPAAEAFQKKYGVKADYVRADSTEVALRIINEAKAGRTIADVFDGTTVTPGLKKAGLVMQWTPEAAKRFGRHHPMAGRAPGEGVRAAEEAGAHKHPSGYGTANVHGGACLISRPESSPHLIGSAPPKQVMFW